MVLHQSLSAVTVVRSKIFFNQEHTVSFIVDISLIAQQQGIAK